MSTPSRIKRITAPELSARKGGEPIAVLTAYTAPMAQFLDEHVDCLLVGDSLGMVVYGLDTTLAVTLDMMINHGAAVVRGSHRACVIVDMPFASYQESPEQAYRNAARMMQETGADGVKLEAGVALASTGTGDITLNSDDTLLLDADGVLELNSSAGAISIGNDAVAQAINIGTGAAARTITVGNTTGATSS